ncbi:MAG: EAL domain-containing protein [Gammaproteobacteria bacterium]|nr:EAL domain-containing protein [Gammaproteobacteria bacterium]
MNRPINKYNKWIAALLSSFSVKLFAENNSMQDANGSSSLYFDNTVMYVIFTFSFIAVIFLIFTLVRFKRYQSRISDSEKRLKLSLWASGDEMWDWDIELGQLSRANGSGFYMLPEVDKDTFPPNQDNIHPDDLPRVRKVLLKHLSGQEQIFECAYRLRSNDKENEWSWILDKGRVVSRNHAGKPTRMTGTFKDIQELKEKENELKIFAQSIQSISEGVLILDKNLNVLHVNPGYVAISGKTPNDVIGKKLQFNDLSMSLIQNIKTQVDSSGSWNGEITGQHSNGTMYLAYVTANCIKDQFNNITNYVAIISDTTKRKQAEAKLIKMATTDTLTKLPNRNVFFSNLQKCVQRKTAAAILVFDIDDFKKINDSIGHQTGDILLKEIGLRISKLISKNNALYRLGGDEFALIMEDTNDIHKITLTAKKILAELSTPFKVNHHELVVAGSIGIVLFPEDGAQPETLLKNADTAMYHAKEDGNHYLFFNAEMNKRAVKRLQIENLIRQGIKENNFGVYYQPKASLKTGRISGMEALVRFITPKKGLISPGLFIPIAEDTGQIVEIGDIVLHKACVDMKRWIDQGVLDGRVAVNLSARQFTLPDLTERIDRILSATGLHPNNLELEITEGTVMNNPKHAINIMHELRKKGIHLALDDFGTGYSSLSYLRQFPLNTLKIDKAFVDDSESKVGKAMIDTIITIARNLDLQTVAEGIETEKQRRFMTSMGCDVIQGYYYSKPLSPIEFEKFAKQDNKQLSAAV